jgi:hypothetical protein
MRVLLGLAARKRGGYRRALPAPDQPPRLRVQSMDGHVATIVLSDREGMKRRKPRGASGAVIRSFVGDVGGLPADFSEWKHAGMTTRTINRIAFDARLAPGTKVWLAAYWVSRVGKQSRPCEPVLIYVAGGGPMMQSPHALRAARMLFVPGLAKAA